MKEVSKCVLDSTGLGRNLMAGFRKHGRNFLASRTNINLSGLSSIIREAN